mmetsp:Transcript_19119/g.45016  ORF Transcript_19119/g.45016 Transcript_19119/m.45016 type:complete len:449 (+) Transcript_19119:102-1448(+)
MAAYGRAQPGPGARGLQQNTNSLGPHSFTRLPAETPPSMAFPGQASSSSLQAPGSFQNLSAGGQSPQPLGSFPNLGARLPAQQQHSFTAAGSPSSGAYRGPFIASPMQGVVRAPEEPGSANSASRPLQLGSIFGSTAHGPAGSKGECKDQQCAEEECDPEECGDEHRAPRDDNYTCGIDRRPLLPVLLVTSTLMGALHNMMVEFPLLRDLWSGALVLRGFFLILYLATLGCMAFCVLFDPGQLSRSDKREAYARLEGEAERSDGAVEGEPPLPKRCHKAWLWKSPIRRYDHFCRWVTNCIGLLNHREFIIMLSGLVAIGVLGSLLDCILLLACLVQGRSHTQTFFLVIHLVYSIGLTSLAGPIFRLHVGFVSRNELANEWKQNKFYVVNSLRTGATLPVNELSDDEFNERFDAFEYDKSRNPWDKGASNNCWAFWCTPRWRPGELGEF